MERKKYVLRNILEEDEFSYFVKYDSVHGIGVSPDSGVRINRLSESCYNPNYIQEAARRLGVDLSYDGAVVGKKVKARKKVKK